LDSPVVRNAVAAALASAAAALLYRKSKKVGDDDDFALALENEVDEVYAAPAQRSAAKRARQKATNAAVKVSDATSAAVSKAARSPVAKAARKAAVETGKVVVEKATKAATAKALKAIASIPNGRNAVPKATTAPAEVTPGRKTRSDAGTRRTPRQTRPEVGAATAFDVADLDAISSTSTGNSGAAPTEVMPEALELAEERVDGLDPS
jgi:hypothetical protein